MSVLLYIPGLLVVLFKRHGLIGTLRHMLSLLAVQTVIARTFLRTYPREYFANAFEFSRVFIYRWTVNWRFISEETFLSRKWAYSLLAGHLFVLAAFAICKWCKGDGGVVKVLLRGLKNPMSGGSPKKVSSDRMPRPFKTNI